MQACTRGHLAVCEILVRAGANLDLTNTEGLSALQIATGKGFHGIVELLSAHGAGRNSPDNNDKLTLEKK
jgi:ankyrin repeat protein